MNEHRYNIKLPIIGTPSRAETAGQCYRKHAIGDLLNMHDPERDIDALAFGTVMHAGSYAHWKGQNVDAAIVRAYKENADFLPGPKNKHSLSLARDLGAFYEGNVRLAAGHPLADLDGWTIEVAEERMEMDIGSLGRLRFQLDRLVVNHDLKVRVLVDLKTFSAYFKSPYMRTKWRAQWETSPQQKLYQLAVKDRWDDGYPLFHYIEGLMKEVPGEIENARLPDWSDEMLEEAREQFLTVVQKDARLVAWATERADDGTTFVNMDLLTNLILSKSEFNGKFCDEFYGCEYKPLCTSDPRMRSTILRERYEYVEPTYMD